MLEYTKLLIPSILKYTRSPYELIFIDIGSLDGTAEYLAGVATVHPSIRVEVVRTPTDLGIKDLVEMRAKAWRVGVSQPDISAELWNTLGDGLYEFGRTVEARSAYHKALAVNGSHVRSRYNLAWVHARERDYPAALAAIAEALGLDKTGEFRDRLLHKQQEVLTHLALRNQQEYLLLINLVSKYAKQDKDGETPKPAEVPEKKD